MLPELAALHTAYPRSLRLSEIADSTGKLAPVVHSNLQRAVRNGQVIKVRKGTYQWVPSLGDPDHEINLKFIVEFKNIIEQGNIYKINELRMYLDTLVKNYNEYLVASHSLSKLNIVYENYFNMVSKQQFDDLIKVANDMANALEGLRDLSDVFNSIDEATPDMINDIYNAEYKEHTRKALISAKKYQEKYPVEE